MSEASIIGDLAHRFGHRIAVSQPEDLAALLSILDRCSGSHDEAARKFCALLAMAVRKEVAAHSTDGRAPGVAN